MEQSKTALQNKCLSREVASLRSHLRGELMGKREPATLTASRRAFQAVMSRGPEMGKSLVCSKDERSM